MSTKDPDGVQEDMAKREVTAPACRNLKKMRCRKCDNCLKEDFETNDPGEDKLELLYHIPVSLRVLTFCSLNFAARALQ